MSKYIAENFVCEELITLFIEIIKAYGFCCTDVGIIFEKHVIFSSVSYLDCNIS